MGDKPTRMKLSVRDMRGGGTILLTSSAALPSLGMAPVEWSARTTAWSGTGQDLYFVDLGGETEAYAIRRYRGGEKAAEPPIATGVSPDSYIRDLWVSPLTGRLAFLSSGTGIGVTVHELDPETRAVRALVKFDSKEPFIGLALRGWLDRSLILVRTVAAYPDRTDDAEIMLVDSSGNLKTAGRVTRVFANTIRLHPSRATSVHDARGIRNAQRIHVLSRDRRS